MINYEFNVTIETICNIESLNDTDVVDLQAFKYLNCDYILKKRNACIKLLFFVANKSINLLIINFINPFFYNKFY